MNRIIKNALFLYGRLMFTMFISLYISRLVLSLLGVEDFGIYNVVGSIVTMFSFINNALASSTQRFISYELGKGTSNNVKEIFSMSVNIHLFLGLLMFMLMIFVGKWFISNKLNIPCDRLETVNYVFYISLITFVVNFVSTPYYGTMIAFEKFVAITWFGIIDSILRLISVILLSSIDGHQFDYLLIYAISYSVITVFMKLLQVFYCLYKIDDVRYGITWQWSLFKKMFSFSGWSLVGNIAAILMNQGINILLNIFFGPSINAARAVSMQVSTAINQFATNLQMVFNPQIVKNYSSKNDDVMKEIIFIGSKYSYFFMLLLCVPIIMNVQGILEFWLSEYPKYSEIFVVLMLVNLIINSLSHTLMTAISATGKIALYQSVVGGVLLFNLPLSYVFLLKGYEPVVTVVISTILSFVTLFIRMYFAEIQVGNIAREFTKEVLLHVVLVTAILSIVLSLAYGFLLNLNLIACLIVVGFTTLITIIIVGMNSNERLHVYNAIKGLVR